MKGDLQRQIMTKY